MSALGGYFRVSRLGSDRLGVVHQDPISVARKSRIEADHVALLLHRELVTTVVPTCCPLAIRVSFLCMPIGENNAHPMLLYFTIIMR